MKTYIIQHVPFEKPGILDAIDHELIKTFEDSSELPEPEQVDFLIVLGGPMNVDDDIPGLVQEKELIKQLINQKKPILGICLGAQLIAQALGAEIYRNPKGKEVGFASIYKQTTAYSFLPNDLEVLHWHGDTFTLPRESVKLYSTPFCENQAFIYNENIIGLQFHMETTRDTLDDILRNDQAYLENSVLQTTEEELASHVIPAENQHILLSIVDYLMKG